MATVLVVYHSQSGNTEEMAKAVARGAKAVVGTEVVLKKAKDAFLEDLVSCAGIAIGSPDYFSYMTGAVKDFFDRTFYPSQGKVTGKPCVLFVTGGGGGGPALESLERICRSFKFKKVGKVTTAGKPSSGVIAECEKLGNQLANTVK